MADWMVHTNPVMLIRAKEPNRMSRRSSVAKLTVVAFIVQPSLRQKIVIVIGVEVGFSRSLTTEGFTITNLLKVVQTAGDAAVAVAVESVEVDGGSAVHAGVDLAADENGIAVSVHDAGSGGGVGIHEVASCVGGIIGAFGIAVTQRSLDNGESRDGLAVALELRLALMIGGFDGSLDLLDGDGIALGDDEGNAELGRTTVDTLGFPDVCVRPASVLAGDDLHGVVDFGVVIRHNRLLL